MRGYQTICSNLTINNLINRIAERSAVYYHKKGLRSVNALIDVDQNLIATYKYDVFSAVTVQTGTMDNSYKLILRELDIDSNLHFYRLRYYNSIIG